MGFKKYVDMIVKYDTEGKIIPLALVWDDGKLYEIDRVLDVRPAASLKAGGAGMRYLCRIQGHERYVFLEEKRWFVEARA